jgi:hypothetical protein
LNLKAIDWSAAQNDLNASGFSILPQILSPADRTSFTNLYDDDANFRSRVVMARHGYGKGEYKYFSYPLPKLVTDLRAALYPPLAQIANDWNEALKKRPALPGGPRRIFGALPRCGAGAADAIAAALRRGRLQLSASGPLWRACLSVAGGLPVVRAGTRFRGRRIRPHRTAPAHAKRAEVVPLRQGDAVVFAVNERPVRGTKGVYRVKMRHGVSRLRVGQRHTLGIIFHDAK